MNLKQTTANRLPSGWVATPIRQAIQPRINRVRPNDHTNARFIGMDHIEAHSTKIVGSRAASGMKSSALSFEAGDVLYGRLRPYLNKVAQPKFDGLASAEFIVFPDTELLRSHFLKHRLNAADFVSFASHLNEGDRPRVKFSQIGDFNILIPPPLEQLRIVSKVEKLFSELDKGIESLKTARAQLKVYRLALLEQAFEGKLTARWREENKDKLETVEQLLDRVERRRKSRYEEQLKEWKSAVKTWEESGNFGRKPPRPPKLKQMPPVTPTELETLPSLPAGWTYLRLGIVIDAPKYGTSKKCDYEYEGTGVLRIPNIVHGVVDASDLKGAQFDEAEQRLYGLSSGDILVIRSNGSISIVGRCALVSKAEEQYLYAGYLIRLRSNPATMQPEYLFSLLSSHLIRIQIEHKAKSTSGVNNINSGEIQSLVIPYCNLDEQRIVVEHLSKQLSALVVAEAEIDTQLRKADALRQSILKKAFSGELVNQDPDDEPAAALLERIKAEKASQKPRAKPRQRKVANA